MKTLALDIGGVCISLHQAKAYASLGIADLDRTPEPFERAVREYNCGRLDSAGFSRFLDAFTKEKLPQDARLAECRSQGASALERELCRRWRLFLGKEIPETTALIRGLLARGWRVVFFSDTQPWHAEILPEIISYFGEVSGTVYSCEVGEEKPSPLMYRAFEERFGRPALYLDDRACNIAGGRDSGWNAVQYTPEKSRAILEELEGNFE